MSKLRLLCLGVGDAFSALSRTANVLANNTDLIVISADQDADSLAKAWFALHGRTPRSSVSRSTRPPPVAHGVMASRPCSQISTRRFEVIPSMWSPRLRRAASPYRACRAPRSLSTETSSPTSAAAGSPRCTAPSSTSYPGWTTGASSGVRRRARWFVPSSRPPLLERLHRVTALAPGSGVFARPRR